MTHMRSEEWRNWIEAVCSNGNHAHIDRGAARVCVDTKCWWDSPHHYA